jgi:peptidoglycan/xylan/chitin deacetylase (PgdA/CDA1 family)
VAGTVFPLDHWLENPAAIRRLAAWLAVDGGIIILHDGAARGPRTAEVLDQLIPILRARGFTFGRLSDHLPAPAR